MQGAVILLGGSLTVMGAVMVAPVLPKIAADVGQTHVQATTLIPLIATGPALAIALFAPAAGWLADRFGRKWLLMLATLLYAVLGFTPALLNDLGDILLMRLLFGCTEAVIMTCCTTLIGDYWSGEERTKWIGRQVVAVGLIGSMFFVVGGAMGENSWRSPFYLYLLPLLLLPAMARVLWEPTRRTDVRQHPVAVQGPNIRAMASAYFLVFIGMVGSFIVPVQSPGILVGLGVTSTTMIGLCAGLGLLATLLGSVIWPYARGKFGTAWINAALLTLMAIGLGILATAATYETVLVAVTIHGLAAGLLVPNALSPLLDRLPEPLRARGVGGFTSCLYLGQFISPVAMSVLSGPGLNIAGAIIIFTGLLMVLALAWVLVSTRYPGPDTLPDK
ncbi:MAG: MFS transporter [Niveispirillum sp.]|uniref:MFS transporter n=1 Tax=Niveispirillum sp. TaxID=1917217 RepID=UPI003BA652AF